jgi:2-oxoglutarate dehydrogenase complex dehydrogenase (E1) component-like enzyme
MAAGEMPMDWGFAETMAYAGLIEDGYGLRLVGQDSGRGTFLPPSRRAAQPGRRQFPSAAGSTLSEKRSPRSP